ncbi:MAG: hypothetical protein L6R38_003704 [Xanthoria sp. 2 TBL-2021]|nr:MAG: hypothetical protein L6R38_003704 [Xanthoria sp. 2 TBL-2021]
MRVTSKIYLKLENLQPSGSFKSRGIGNLMRSSFSFDIDSVNNGSRHFYSSSGGNAGLGCVHAAVALDSPATIVIPTSTTEYMKSKLRNAGALEVIQHGKSWAEADGYLRENLLPEARVRGEQAVYVPPFDAQEIWDGHATLVHEIAEQLTEEEDEEGQDCQTDGHRTAVLDALVCSVGGGGLLCGIMQGLEDVNLQAARVLAMETYGADSLSQALKAGHLVTLPAITSIATSLGARTVCRKAFEYGQKTTVKSVVLTDKEAVHACQRFADDERLLVEPACGVCVAVCYDGRLERLLPDLQEDSKVVIVICGGSNVSLEILEKWANDYK